MTSDKPIIFYDICSGPPVRTFAPNPFKTRMALNHKKVHYKTQTVDMPDIAQLRESLGVPANRTYVHGAPYHTLPCIQDQSTAQVVGDSFEIALYLDKQYPDGPALFRPNTHGLTAAFNSQVDGLFTKYSILAARMPFEGHPREQEIKQIFLDRFGAKDWDAFQIKEEDREKQMTAFEAALGEFVKAYKHVGGTTDYMLRPGGTAAEQSQTSTRQDKSIWLDGQEPCYADFITGAWLAMFSESMRPEDWAKVREWHGGFFGKLHDALEPWRASK